MPSAFSNPSRERKAAFEEWARRFEPSAEETAAWVDEQRTIRAQWAAGPSAGEIQDWAERTKWSRAFNAASSAEERYEGALPHDHWLREIELAAKEPSLSISDKQHAPGLGTR